MLIRLIGRRVARTIAVCLVGLPIAGSLHAAKPEPKKDPPVVRERDGLPEIITLFDGKTLDNWEGNKDLWSVVDGEIVGKSSAPLKVSTYLLPAVGGKPREFSDFRLTAKVKLVTSEIHSGVAFWGNLAPDRGDKYAYAGLLVMFPSGWGMFDLYGRNGLPVDPEPAKKVGKQHDWNELEILAVGNRVRVGVNGVEVVDWRDPERKTTKEGFGVEGPIGLQLHSNDNPQEVHFKELIMTTFPGNKMVTVKEEKKDEKK